MIKRLVDEDKLKHAILNKEEKKQRDSLL